MNLVSFALEKVVTTEFIHHNKKSSVDIRSIDRGYKVTGFLLFTTNILYHTFIDIARFFMKNMQMSESVEELGGIISYGE